MHIIANIQGANVKQQHIRLSGRLWATYELFMLRCQENNQADRYLHMHILDRP